MVALVEDVPGCVVIIRVVCGLVASPGDICIYTCMHQAARSSTQYTLTSVRGHCENLLSALRNIATLQTAFSVTWVNLKTSAAFAFLREEGSANSLCLSIMSNGN
jgi:hypothetical protein